MEGSEGKAEKEMEASSSCAVLRGRGGGDNGIDGGIANSADGSVEKRWGRASGGVLLIPNALNEGGVAGGVLQSVLQSVLRPVLRPVL